MKRLLYIAHCIDEVNRHLSKIASWLVLLCCLISAGNALSRYGLNLSSNAWLEIQWYMFSAMFMLGTSYTLCRNEHVRVDVIYARLSTRAQIWIDLIGRIDDPVGGIAVHGIGGLWGTIAAGFLTYGSFSHRLRQTGVQLLGIIAIGMLALALSAILMLVLKRIVRLRVSEDDEFEGLDLAQHDIGAYPDFQQNTIKSYHLREA